MIDIPKFLSAMLEYFLSSDIIQAIFDVVIAVVMVIVSILLLPISLLIKQYFPEYNANLAALANVFTLILDYTGWIASAVGIPPFMLTLVSGYFIFLLNSKVMVFFFKHALHWYKAFKI